MPAYLYYLLILLLITSCKSISDAPKAHYSNYALYQSSSSLLLYPNGRFEYLMLGNTGNMHSKGTYTKASNGYLLQSDSCFHPNYLAPKLLPKAQPTDSLRVQVIIGKEKEALTGALIWINDRSDPYFCNPLDYFVVEEQSIDSIRVQFLGWQKRKQFQPAIQQHLEIHLNPEDKMEVYFDQALWKLGHKCLIAPNGIIFHKN